MRQHRPACQASRWRRQREGGLACSTSATTDVRNNRHQLKGVLFLLSVLTISTSASTTGPFHPLALQNFISSRCNAEPAGPRDSNGNGGSAVWSYEGSLVDPTNGRIVAEVEGVELCRHLSEVHNMDTKVLARDDGGGADSEGKAAQLRSMARGLKRMGNLKAKDMLLEARRNPDQHWDYATTVLSRRMFVYRAPPAEQIAAKIGDQNVAGSATTPSNTFRLPPSLLRSIRFRPNSPEKRLELTDSVAVYDTATTYISRNQGRSMSILTEFADGHWVMGSTDSAANGGSEDNQANGSNLFEYGVYARMGSGGGGVAKSKKNMPSLVPIRVGAAQGSVKGSDKETSATTGSVVISPPRSKLIQFGKDNSVERARYGARETYSFEHLPSSGEAGNISSGVGNVFGRIANRARESLPFFSAQTTASLQPIVRYTRYGESPPWYRPSQPATLELRGKRIESFDDAPPLISSLASRYVPGLLAVDCPIPSGPSPGYLNKFGKKKRDDAIQNFQRLQSEADASATRTVEWFRNPPSNGGELITLLDENNDWDDQQDDPFGNTSKLQVFTRRMKRSANKAVKNGTNVASRIWDATAVKSTSSATR